MSESRRPPGLRVGEAMALASPFVALVLSFGFATGTLKLTHWPRLVDNTVRSWLPMVFAFLTYGFLILNLFAVRRRTWRWFTDGLISVVVLWVVWGMLEPIYEQSWGYHERARVGLRY